MQMRRSGPEADHVAAYLRASGLFDAQWYAHVHTDVAASGLTPFEHYLAVGLPAGRAPNARLHLLDVSEGRPEETGGAMVAVPVAPDAEASARLDAALLEAAGTFDANYYLANNPDVAAAGGDPLLHFCRYGWKELRNPSPGFDVWWYWASFLDPVAELINPLVHQALFSAARTLPGRPQIGPLPESAPLPPRARRICLFAGYDPD